MKEVVSYLKNDLGLSISFESWGDSKALPLFLTKAAEYYFCSCEGIQFVVAEVKQGLSLPDLKRISSQRGSRGYDCLQ